MIEIASGIVLAVIFLALLPFLLRLAAYAAVIAFALCAVVLGIMGLFFIAENWAAVSVDPAFWAIVAGAAAFWLWLVFRAKPDWLRSPEPFE